MKEKELEKILDEGISFKCGFLKLTIKQARLGTLFHLSRLFVNIDIPEEAGLPEAKQIANKHLIKMVEAIAISVLNSRWKIKILKWPLVWYMMYKMNPADLRALSIYINSLCNYADFMISIRLMSATTKAIVPNRIEQKG
jgi:hypothetical protein